MAFVPASVQKQSLDGAEADDATAGPTRNVNQRPPPVAPHEIGQHFSAAPAPWVRPEDPTKDAYIWYARFEGPDPGDFYIRGPMVMKAGCLTYLRARVVECGAVSVKEFDEQVRNGTFDDIHADPESFTFPTKEDRILSVQLLRTIDESLKSSFGWTATLLLRVEFVAQPSAIFQRTGVNLEGGFTNDDSANAAMSDLQQTAIGSNLSLKALQVDGRWFCIGVNGTHVYIWQTIISLQGRPQADILKVKDDVFQKLLDFYARSMSQT